MNIATRLLATLITVTAGSAGYLYVLNRLLIQARDRRLKGFMIRAGGLLTLGFSTLLGWRIARTRWVWLSAAVCGIAAAGEVRRLVFRKQHRGSPPVSESGPAGRSAGDLLRPMTTTDLVLRNYRVPVEGWSGPPVRVAHLTDFHLNSHLPLSYFQDALRRVAAQCPDLVIFTGDYITYKKYVPLMVEVLPLAKGKFGSFGIIGNHDQWSDLRLVRAVAESAGVQMIGGKTVRLNVGDGHCVVVSGFEHPWGEKRWVLPERMAGELHLILTHTPDNIYRLQDRGFDAVFAGHYHGGQIRIPGIGPLVVPSKYGRRYDRGHFVFGRTHLFVSAGVGSAEPPVRLWCPPDVLIVDFVPDGA